MWHTKVAGVHPAYAEALTTKLTEVLKSENTAERVETIVEAILMILKGRRHIALGPMRTRNNNSTGQRTYNRDCSRDATQG